MELATGPVVREWTAAGPGGLTQGPQGDPNRR